LISKPNNNYLHQHIIATAWSEHNKTVGSFFIVVLTHHHIFLKLEIEIILNIASCLSDVKKCAIQAKSRELQAD